MPRADVLVGEVREHITFFNERLFASPIPSFYTDTPVPHQFLDPVSFVQTSTPGQASLRQVVAELDTGLPVSAFYVIWRSGLRDYVQRESDVRTGQRQPILWQLAARQAWECLQGEVVARQPVDLKKLGPTRQELRRALHLRMHEVPGEATLRSLARVAQAETLELASFYHECFQHEAGGHLLGRLTISRLVAELAASCYSADSGIGFMKQLKTLLLTRLEIAPDAF